MFAIPFLWLALLHWCDERRGAAWWWLAGAFLISWASNTVQKYMAVDDRWITSAVYPISQAVLVCAVFLPRFRAKQFLVVLMLVALGAIAAFGLRDSTIVLRVAAWGGIVWFVWPLPIGRLRIALLVTFGGALVGWIGYMTNPGTPTWAVYQSLWAFGIVLFCWASWKPQPMLRVVT